MKEFEAGYSSYRLDCIKEFEQLFMTSVEVTWILCMVIFFKKCAYRYRLHNEGTPTGQIRLQQTRMSLKCHSLP